MFKLWLSKLLCLCFVSILLFYGSTYCVAGATSPTKSHLLDSDVESVHLFKSYSTLREQLGMLTDTNRMESYYMAFMLNKEYVKDKVVLDVGAGTGILSLWAAKAGAKRVYAIEYTSMALNARKLLHANGVDDIVTVFQGDADEIVLPSKVDIVVSEWMGAFLLRESMLDVVVRMRDKWMLPGGTMFPSHATILVGAVHDEQERALYEKGSFSVFSDIEWMELENNLKDDYNIDYSVLKEFYIQELEMDLHIGKIVQMKNYKDTFIGSSAIIKQLDLNTCTLEDVKGVSLTSFQIDFGPQFYEDGQIGGKRGKGGGEGEGERGGEGEGEGDGDGDGERGRGVGRGKIGDEREPQTISGFAGWFTVDFNGTALYPLPNPVHLTTHPEWGYTHWGQIVTYLREAFITKTRLLSCTFEMNRMHAKWRNYNISLSCNRDLDQEGATNPMTHYYSLVSF